LAQPISSPKIVFRRDIQFDKKIIFSWCRAEAGGTYTGAVVDIAVFGTSAGILCIAILLGGLY